MAQGYERRTVVENNLRGAEAIDPVTRQLPSVGQPLNVQMPRDTFTQQVTDSVARFAGGALAAAQEQRQKRSAIEGQLAAMQGKAFDEVEMEGDKWKLEGYRGVVAQTLSSSLLRAQEQDIISGAYESDPDAYRQTLLSRIDGMTADITDPRLKEMAIESLMNQMPTLVDAHMKQHLGFKEQQGFDALAQSVDVMSRDASQTENLMAFAMGTSEATQGLSESRRKQAVTQGIVNSFRNDNPAAYARLEAQGFFTTANLTAQQIDQIESARNQYQSRLSQKWNEQHYARTLEIQEQAKNGELDPVAAAEALIQNDADHGRLTTYRDAGLIYSAARDGVEFSQGTRGLNIQAAGMAGDYGTQAALLTDAVEHQESRGNPNAVSPRGATGLMQLMPSTAANPGYGLPNIFQIARQMGRPEGMSVQQLMRDPEVNKRMGTMYLEKMLEINNGDVELALISYNAGKGRADEFVRAGRNWDNISGAWKHESRDYVAKITGNIQDDRPDPEGARRMAERRVQAVRDAAQLQAYEQSYPAIHENERRFRNGEIGQDEFIATNREIFQQYGREVDMNYLSQESQIVRSIMQDIDTRAQANLATENELNYFTAIQPTELEWEQTVKLAEEGVIGQEEVVAALGAITQQRRALQQQFGIQPTVQTEGRVAEQQLRQALEAVQTGHDARARRAVRENAAAYGIAGALPADEQAQLIREQTRRIEQDAMDMVASGNMSEQQAAAHAMTQRTEFLAQSGLVDEQLKTVLNTSLQLNPLEEDGVNPAFVEAVRTYHTMREINPALADRYIDIGSRAVIDNVINRVGEGGNIEAAVWGFGNQYAQVFSGSPNYASTEEISQTNSRNIEREVDRFLNSTDIGVVGAVFGSLKNLRHGNSNNVGLGDLYGNRSFDSEPHREAMREAVIAELDQVRSEAPWMNPQELIRQAGQRVSRRYAVIGNAVHDFGGDPYEAMFGGRAEEMRGRPDAVNAAITSYISSPEFREAYPQANVDLGFMDVATSLTPFGLITGATRRNVESVLTGIPQYDVLSIPDGRGGTSVSIVFPGGMPIPLDMQEVGQAFLRNRDNSWQ